MERWEIEKIIRETVKQELAATLMGKIVSTTDKFRASAQRFPTETPIPNQRIISPYGLASRAKAGMECLVGAINNDPTHLGIVGVNDTGRPTVQDGEVSLYGPDGQQLYLKNGGTIHQGSQAADEPVVLGNVLVEFMINLLTEFIEHDPLGYDSFGLPVELSPEIKAQLIEWRNTYLQTAATNIIGQKNFVERGA